MPEVSQGDVHDPVHDPEDKRRAATDESLVATYRAERADKPKPKSRTPGPEPAHATLPERREPSPPAGQAPALPSPAAQPQPLGASRKLKVSYDD